MKPLVIYRANCTDGFGAAFAAWTKLGDEAEYVPMNYGQAKLHEALPFNPLNREVYILDFSFERQIMDFIFRDAKRVVWLDHHKTAFEMWCQHRPEAIEKGYYCKGWGDEDPEADFVLLDNNKSGALLAWEYFHPGTDVPMLIQHIDDRDRWQFKLEGSKELHAALQSYKPWSFEQWKAFITQADEWDRSPLEKRYNMVQQGTAILRAQDQTVAEQAKQAMKCRINWKQPTELVPTGTHFERTGLALNTQNHISETGHVLANQSGAYGLLWYVAQDGKVKCGLRSNGDYDVSAIAKAFGGDGHRNAADFETNIETLMGWIE